VYAKRNSVTPAIREQHPDAGDIWTWTALDADSKLIVSWSVGPRNSEAALTFMADIASRIRHRFQLSTDGFGAYFYAVDIAFANEIDYATVTKIFKGGHQEAARYSPPKLQSTVRATVRGNPDAGHITTSHVERQNLTMRMHMRRFTRLTNGFSKKAEMHAHAVALHFVYYNFSKVHQTLRVTPAMEAGLADHVWSIEEIVNLVI
jgi:IS1 family transposase